MWYLKILNNLSWINFFILSTIQKLIPLYIINIIINNKYIQIINIILGVFIGLYSSIIGINQNNIKLIICYSSIIQIIWILILILVNENLWIIYFIIYITISLNLFLIFNKYNINNYIIININKYNKNFNYYIINIVIFSYGSIPPFFGFSIKLILLNILRIKISIILIFFLIINSLISLFFYIRILFNNIINNSLSIKLNFKFLNYKIYDNYYYIILNWLSIILLLFIDII